MTRVAGWIGAVALVATTTGCERPRPPEDKLAIANDLGAPGAGQSNGRLLFEETCGACHDRSGSGLPGRAPTLHGSPLVSAPTDVIVRILLDGVHSDAPDAPRYVLPMPSWRIIGDRDLAAVATYVRTSFGNSAPPVTQAEVARVRRETDGRRRSWSRAELAGMGRENTP